MPTTFNDAASAGKSSFNKELNHDEFHGSDMMERENEQ